MGPVHLVRLLAYAMLFLQLCKHTQGQDPSLTQVYTFKSTDLYGLQQLYANWNQSTPDLGKNLAGWRLIPSLQDNTPDNCPCFRRSWQGVLCLRQLLPTPPGFFYQIYNVSIVGLALTDASLSGSLPPAIGNLSSLVSLTITGNADLKGPLPSELENLSYNLNILDLQRNAFNGSIPTTLTSLLQLQELDLSGNRFDGSLQVDFRKLTWLRTLNLSRNSLSGNIQEEYFQGLEQLITVDLSSNNFFGPILSLTKSPSLNTLNLSRNSFSGDLSLSNIFNMSYSSSLKVVDLSNNAFTGLFPNFSPWANLTVLDVSNNKFQTTVFPVWLKNLTSLQILRLKGNNLIGQIPDHFLQDFIYLRILVLDENQINGTLDIGDVVGLEKLESISIKNNSITNVLYGGSDFRNIEKFGINLQGNPYCNQVSTKDFLKQCVCLQNCINSGTTQSGNKRIGAVVIATSVAASLLAIAILIIAMIFLKTKKEEQTLRLQVQQHFAEKDIKPTIFSFNELRNATEDFSERTKIGEGSFAVVYKGILHSNANPVAVKQLFKNQQSITEFLNEVVLVTAIKHRNLVNLKGCCIREDQRLLVYEYLDNNNLAHHLFHQRGNQILTWPTRFNVSLGIARGIHYLHTSVQPRIIHRDIKASNILMDRDLQPKIADFGLALLFPDEQTHIITSDIAGTRGYWAPEYVTMGQLSEKVDIYSFGVLLLELVSGRKNIDHDLPNHQVYLCQWAKELYNNSSVMELLDHGLSLNKDEEEEVRRIINIALLCIQIEPEKRPTMGAVVATLEGSLNLETESMENLFREKAPLTWAQLEEYPLRKVDDTSLFYSETSSSSIISLVSMKNYNNAR